MNPGGRRFEEILRFSPRPQDAVNLGAGNLVRDRILPRSSMGAAKAFLKAFPSGAEAAALVIKTSNMSRLQTERDRAHWKEVLKLAASDKRIRILDRELSGENMAALFEVCDCYLSLHRSEGFGFGPAEALARGKPAIVTAYSGVNDFCTPATAFQVDFELVPVQHGHYPYMDPQKTYYWADPKLESARSHMRLLYNTPEEGIRTGRRAQEFMAARYSTDALWSRYRARLTELGVL